MLELPTTLKNELSIIMHRDTIEQVAFFRDKTDVFVAYCAPLMKPMTFQCDDYIYTKGSLIDEIFFLVKGKVAYVLPEFDDIPFVNIHPNDYFGDIDYVSKDNDGKRQFTVKALDHCEMY